MSLSDIPKIKPSTPIIFLSAAFLAVFVFFFLTPAKKSMDQSAP